METRLLDRHGLGTYRGTRHLLRELDAFRPDLVQLHNLHGYYVNYPMLIQHLRANRVPTVWTMHDAWPMAGHCTHWYRIGCDRWQTACHHCPQQHEYPASIGLDRSRANHRLKRTLFGDWEQLHLVAPSEWMASLAGPSLFHGRPVTVINNDPDFSVFRPRRSGWRSNNGFSSTDYLILAAANVWEDRKGLAYIRDLEPLLRPDERLVVVGKVLDRASLPSNCLHIEQTASADVMAEIYSDVDVYVNPTLEDTSSLTNLESMACGTPCVTFPSAGAPETVTRGWGIVTRAKTSEALRAAIDDLREHGHPQVSVDSSGPRMAEQYVSLYRALLSGDQQGDPALPR